MQERVDAALDKIRPMLVADGGGIDLVSVEGSVVKVKLTGACGHCPMAQMTLKMGVERMLKQEVPEIEAVEAV